MTNPLRVQLSRKKGWRMPPNTIKVARPSKWGNPFRIGGYFMVGDPDRGTHFPMSWCEADPDYATSEFIWVADSKIAVKMFRELLENGYLRNELKDLRGKNLACWCSLNQRCHADVLLEIANT